MRWKWLCHQLSQDLIYPSTAQPALKKLHQWSTCKTCEFFCHFLKASAKPNFTEKSILRQSCLNWSVILIGHLYLSGMWLAPKTDAKKTCVRKRLNYVLKYDHHSKFNSQHNWGDLYDHLMSTRIFTWYWITCSHELRKLWGKWLWHVFKFANHLVLIACSIS